jgi:hypothetical protein
MDKAANDSNDSASGDGSVIKLAGREFESISQALTANQHDFIGGHLRRAGVIEVLADLGPEKPRNDRERAEHLLTRIMLSGEKPFIVAGCLTEKGKVWSRQEALRNAEIFGQINDENELRLMTQTVVALVTHFFMFGALSSPSSPRSSSRGGKDRPTASEAPATSETSPK